MRAFTYARPTSVSEAIGLLAQSGATPLAGGTDLLSLLKDDVERYDLLVDLKAIDELKGIALSGDTLRLGGASTLEELLAAPLVARHAPALLDAVREITAPQIRAMGTLAGDLCQRPRCWYYRSGHGLLGLRNYAPMAEEGDSRYHAIFGEGPARFVSASRLAPALIVHRARVELTGPEGTREMPIEDFFRSPLADTEREIDLAPSEIVTAIQVPVGDWISAGYEVQPRRSLDWPLVAAAVAVRMRGDIAAEARVALGHVAPTPLLSVAASEALTGLELEVSRAEAVGDAAVLGARPLGDNAYKVQLARVSVKRALLEVMRRVKA